MDRADFKPLMAELVLRWPFATDNERARYLDRLWGTVVGWDDDWESALRWAVETSISNPHRGKARPTADQIVAAARRKVQPVQDTFVPEEKIEEPVRKSSSEQLLEWRRKTFPQPPAPRTGVPQPNHEAIARLNKLNKLAARKITASIKRGGTQEELSSRADRIFRATADYLDGRRA